MANLEPAAVNESLPTRFVPATTTNSVSGWTKPLICALRYRRLNLKDHAAWQIVHGAMAFHRAFLIQKDDELVSAIDYALGGARLRAGISSREQCSTRPRGVGVFVHSWTREVSPGKGTLTNGLDISLNVDFSPDETIQVDGETFTIANLVAQAEWDVPRNMSQEYSWTLMALSAYRPPDYTWKASDGQTWSIERLVEIEAEHDLASSACGGCHRLFALASALNRHLAQGGELVGGWKKANDKIEDSIAKAKAYQNPDGSFSTNHFQRPGRSADMLQNLGATGHILEFLTAALIARGAGRTVGSSGGAQGS
jgi:hypothetical protein